MTHVVRNRSGVQFTRRNLWSVSLESQTQGPLSLWSISLHPWPVTLGSLSSWEIWLPSSKAFWEAAADYKLLGMGLRDRELIAHAGNRSAITGDLRPATPEKRPSGPKVKFLDSRPGCRLPASTCSNS
jgi:hypothetical protein